MSAKSFTFIALLKPDAKKPPNGAITDANSDSTRECNWNSVNYTLFYSRNDYVQRGKSKTTMLVNIGLGVHVNY